MLRYFAFFLIFICSVLVRASGPSDTQKYGLDRQREADTTFKSCRDSDFNRIPGKLLFSHLQAVVSDKFTVDIQGSFLQDLQCDSALNYAKRNHEAPPAQNQWQDFFGYFDRPVIHEDDIFNRIPDQELYKKPFFTLSISSNDGNTKSASFLIDYVHIEPSRDGKTLVATFDQIIVESLNYLKYNWVYYGWPNTLQYPPFASVLGSEKFKFFVIYDLKTQKIEMKIVAQDKDPDLESGPVAKITKQDYDESPSATH